MADTLSPVNHSNMGVCRYSTVPIKGLDLCIIYFPVHFTTILMAAGYSAYLDDSVTQWRYFNQLHENAWNAFQVTAVLSTGTGESIVFL